jgi:hypothetical protein
MTDKYINYNSPSKKDLIHDSCIDFYKNRNNIKLLVNLLDKRSMVSLRVLDWLVTNYSNKNNIIIFNYLDGRKYPLNIHSSYKSQLKAYSKKYFDPFCRRDRININLIDLDCSFGIKDILITTIGQLNFFRWFIQNNLINYLLNNIREIDTDMNNSITRRVNSIDSPSENTRTQIIHSDVTVTF